MSFRMIKALSGVIICYFLGWLSHKNPSFNAPKYLSYICGAKRHALNPYGLTLQLIALLFLIGIIVSIVTENEIYINMIGIGGTLLSCLIYLVISIILSIIKRLK